MNKVVIELTARGRGKVLINGDLLPNVESVQVLASAIGDRVNRVHIVMIPDRVRVVAKEAEVTTDGIATN